MQRHAVAPPRAPPRIGLEQLRSGQGHHEDRVARRAFDQVGDEVEKSRIGPMQVFEYECGWAPLGDVVEEGSDGGEEFFAVSARGVFESEQCRQARLEPAAVLLGRHVLGDGRA